MYSLLSIICLIFLSVHSQFSNIKLGLSFNTNSFQVNRAILGGIGPIKKISSSHQYQGNITITVKEGEIKNLLFWITYAQNPTDCQFKSCFLGWVSKYSVNDQGQVLGYPNAEGVQPIFTFNVNSDQDYKVSYTQRLKKIWKQIIDVACQKFNPLQVTPENKNRKFSFVNPSLQASTSRLFNSNQNKDLQASINENIQVNGLRVKNANNVETISINPENNLINKRNQQFNIKLQTDKDQSDIGQTPSFNGLLILNLNRLSSYSSNQKQLNNIKTLINNQNNNNEINSQSDSASKIIQGDDDDPYPKDQTEDVPQTQIHGDQPFPGEQLDDVDIIKEFNKQEPGPGPVNPVQPNSNVNLRATQIKKQIILNDVSTIQVLNFPPNRVLAIDSIVVLSYTQTLYSKTIFGKLVELKISVQCSLIGYIKIGCSGKLYFILFGKQNPLTVFSFQRPVNSIWNWGKPFSGSWGHDFRIPLPPPVSFMSINFVVGAGYQFKVQLFSKIALKSPYTTKFGVLIVAGISAYARASLRAFQAIEGGVFLNGKLIQVGTDPTITFKFNFKQKSIQVLRQWYFWIIAFYFQWGFFYRYKFWKNWKWQWTDPITIESWSLTGIYKKYTIINNTMTIKL